MLILKRKKKSGFISCLKYENCLRVKLILHRKFCLSIYFDFYKNLNPKNWCFFSKLNSLIFLKFQLIRDYLH